MSKLKTIISVSIAAATFAMGAGTMAEARDFRGNGSRPGFAHGPAPRAYAPPARHYGYANSYRRDRTGNRIAAGIAIGVGAAILGSIIANQNRGYDRY